MRASGLLASVIAAGMVAGAVPAGAHPGGLAADGCHRERATGTRHCHADPVQPVPFGGFDDAFVNFDAARAAGRSNIRIGEPGYGPHLDRDRDGIACES